MGMIGKLFGRGERIDPRPLELPAGMMLPETAEQKIERMIRTRLSAVAAESGEESFEEANDFDVGDEDPTALPTSHEMASEFMEDIKHEATERDRGSDDRGNTTDRDTEEPVRGKRNDEGSHRNKRGVQLDSEVGEEDESGAPARARRDERDGNARTDRRGWKDESRRPRDSRTRDGRGDE